MIKSLDMLDASPPAHAPAPRSKAFRGHLDAAASDVDAAQRLAALLGQQQAHAAPGHRHASVETGPRRIAANDAHAAGHRQIAAPDGRGPIGTAGPSQIADDGASDATDGPAAPTVAAPTAATHTDSPVAALLAAAVGRAIGSLGIAPAEQPAPAIATEAVTAPTSILTPLEQALHDLIAIAHAEPQHDEPHADDREPVALPVLAAPAQTSAPDEAPAPQPVHVAPVTAPEPPANPSHVHLVLDDGPERVVVTVAVRGADVHVALRGGDDTTAASLARNAASLDHAMRARGMQLADFTHDREPPRERSRDTDHEPRRERRDQHERFTLEETP